MEWENNNNVITNQKLRYILNNMNQVKYNRQGWMLNKFPKKISKCSNSNDNGKMCG